MPVKRVCILGGVITLLFLLLAARIAMLQLIPDSTLKEAAFRQRVSGMDVERRRGNILDRNNIPFTNREIKYTALIKTACMPEAEERKKIFEAMNVEVPDGLSSKSMPVLLEISEDGRDALKSSDADWISVISSLERYGGDSLARHVIGYLNRRDQVGQSGIEKAYERVLRDNAVFRIGTITDAANDPIKGFGYRVKEWSSDSRLGIRLTLDYHVQKIVEEAMDKNGLSGAVVVEDVVTGDILAMASRPHFDQNAVEKYLDSSSKELFNKATAAYNLGSIFKIIDLAAFFENEEDILFGDDDKNRAGEDAVQGEADGQADEYRFFDGFSYRLFPFDDLFDIGTVIGRHEFHDPDHYYCSGAVDINGLTFKCYSYYEGGHGEIDLERAFALSCNSYFIELGQRIGYRRLLEMAQRFGLGCRTGISEQGIAEAAGNLPDINAYHSRADIANIAIGQGAILATPVQVADLTATVANGGIRNKVNIVDSIVDEKGRIVEKIKVSEGRRIISKETSDRIKEMMEAVTLNGTGTEAVTGYWGGAGGKTGSAETGSKDVVHAWFTGYFPAAEPRYSVAVFAEDGRLGGRAAAPVFAAIAGSMLEKGY